MTCAAPSSACSTSLAPRTRGLASTAAAWRPPCTEPSPVNAHEDLLRRAYEAFNARDIDSALALMHPDVDWPNGMEGGRVLGRAAVREYWTRQFQVIDSRVEPEGFTTDADGRGAVDVHQVVAGAA